MTLASSWNHYLGVLRAELPTLARSITALARESVLTALDREAHPASRKNLLALAHLLRPESTAFADTLTNALRRELHDMESASVRDPSKPPTVGHRLPGRHVELAGVIELIEATARWELRELQALCASSRRAHSIRPESNPLRPEACARALLTTLEDSGLDDEACALGLRVNGLSLAATLREFYAQHCRLLRRSGLPVQRSRTKLPRIGAPDDRRRVLRSVVERLTARAGRRDPGSA